MTPKSLTLWRAHHAPLAGEDFDTVRQYLGGASINVVNQLKLTYNEQKLNQGLVVLRESGDAPAEIRVTIEEFFDCSITLRGRAKRKAHPTPSTEVRHYQLG